MGSFGLDGRHKLPPSISDLFYFLISSLIKCLLGLWTLTKVCVCVCTMNGIDTKRTEILLTGFHVS